MARFNPDVPGSSPEIEELPGSDSVKIAFDGTELAPTAYEVEASGSAKMTEFTDQCGYSESEKLGPGTLTITIQAILYKSYVQDMYRIYEDGDTIEVTHPAEIGTFDLILQDFTISQVGDHNEFVDDKGLEQEIFDTQIQLKSPNAETEA